MKKTATVFLILFLGSCGVIPEETLRQISEKIPKPTAELESFSIAKISLRDITFRLGVKVKNPYPVGLKLESIIMDFFVENKKLVQTRSEAFQVPASQSKTNTFDVVLTYKDIINIVRDYTSKDYLDCEVKMQINIPVPKFAQGPPRLSFDFQAQRKIPAIKPVVRVRNFRVMPPEIDDVKKSLQDEALSIDPAKVQNMFTSLFSGKSVSQVVDPKKLDLKFRVLFDLAMKNEAKAPLDFDKVNYNFAVNNEKLVTGDTSDIVRQGSETILKISNEFSSRNLTSQVLQAFRTGQGNFGVSGNTRLNVPGNVFGSSLDLGFDEKGSFSLR